MTNEITLLQRNIRRNKILELIYGPTKTVALMLASGTLIQTLLAVLGFTSSQIYIHTTLLQAANVLTIMLASKWAEGKNIFHRAALATTPTALLYIPYVPLALNSDNSVRSLVVLILVGMGQQICVGLTTVCDYKLPYYMYRATDYGRMIAISGIISSIASLGVGSLISAMTAKYNFITVISIAFAVATALMGIVVMCMLLLRDVSQKDGEESKVQEGTKINTVTLFKTPVFYRLIPANLLRGFARGVVDVLATVAIQLGFNEMLTTKLTAAAAIAGLAANLLFSIITKRLAPNKPVMLGTFAVMLFPLLLFGNSTSFLIVYTVILFGRTIVDAAVPAQLIHAVSVDIAGPYHAWRMVMQFSGQLVATAVAAFLPTPALLIIATAAQLASGILFYAFGKAAKSK